MRPAPMMNTNVPMAGLMRQWMAVFYVFATILTAPAEMLLRRRFGSMYLHPVTLVISLFLAQCLALVGIVADPAIRLMTGSSSWALGMPTLLIAFVCLLIFHLFRIARLMRHMELEEYSESDGDPLPPFTWLPHATWTMIRTVYEPVFVGGGAFFLWTAGLLEPFALAYLIVVAFMMSAKQSLRLYSDWLRRREVLDMQYLLNLGRRIAIGEPLRSRDHMLLPSGQVPATHNERMILAHTITRSLPPELTALITPLESAAVN